MKKIINRFFCWIFKRHTIEYMVAHSGKVHNFYGINGPGKMCVCPKCGKSVIAYTRRVRVVNAARLCAGGKK